LHYPAKESLSAGEQKAILHHITPLGFVGINGGAISVFPLERYHTI
jgi:hypothetical protein